MKISLEKLKKLAEELLVISSDWPSQEFRLSVERLICRLVESASVDNSKTSFQYLTAMEIIFSLAGQKGDTENRVTEFIAELFAELPNNSAIRQEVVNNSANIGNDGDLNLEVRQSAILAKIRELSVKEDGCALKELKECFPDIAERTLRYDLQRLSAKGSIIKIGNRGPNTMYRAMG